MKGRVKANLAAGVLLLSVALAAAQGPNAHKNMRMYDPATETTLKGTVEAVTQPTRGRMMGTHLTIKVGDQTQEIMLGPAKFIASKESSQQDFVAGGILRGFPEFLKSDVFGVSHGHTLRFQ